MIHEKLILETLDTLLNDSVQMAETMAGIVEAMNEKLPALSSHEQSRLKELSVALRTRVSSRKVAVSRLKGVLASYDSAKGKVSDN